MTTVQKQNSNAGIEDKTTNLLDNRLVKNKMGKYTFSFIEEGSLAASDSIIEVLDYKAAEREAKLRLLSQEGNEDEVAIKLITRKSDGALMAFGKFKDSKGVERTAWCSQNLAEALHEMPQDSTFAVQGKNRWISVDPTMIAFYIMRGADAEGEETIYPRLGVPVTEPELV